MKESPKHVGAVHIGFFCLIFFLSGLSGTFSEVFAWKAAGQPLVLGRAVVCEAVQGYEPVNPGITFSIQTGSISCFTRFDTVAEDTAIRHRWYRRDYLVTEQRLVLKSPQWSTFSRIQLREVDKGPWRVEVVDDNGRVLTILRFSVTE